MDYFDLAARASEFECRFSGDLMANIVAIFHDECKRAFIEGDEAALKVHMEELDKALSCFSLVG